MGGTTIEPSTTRSSARIANRNSIGAPKRDRFSPDPTVSSRRRKSGNDQNKIISSIVQQSDVNETVELVDSMVEKKKNVSTKCDGIKKASMANVLVNKSKVTPKKFKTVQQKKPKSATKPAVVEMNNSVDLSDSILDNQNVILTEKDKTEGEHAEERLNLEFEKQMKSPSSCLISEKPFIIRRDSFHLESPENLVPSSISPRMGSNDRESMTVITATSPVVGRVSVDERIQMLSSSPISSAFGSSAGSTPTSNGPRIHDSLSISALSPSTPNLLPPPPDKFDNDQSKIVSSFVEQSNVNEMVEQIDNMVEKKKNVSTKCDGIKKASMTNVLVNKSKVMPEKSKTVQQKKPKSATKPAVVKMNNSIDLLDSILDNQNVMLTEKYKTEDERAEERQKLEFEKRMKNPSSCLIPEKPLIIRRDSFQLESPENFVPSNVSPRMDSNYHQSMAVVTASSPSGIGRVSVDERIQKLLNSPISPAFGSSTGSTPTSNGPKIHGSRSASTLSPATPTLSQFPPPPPGPRPFNALTVIPPPQPPRGPRPATAHPICPAQLPLPPEPRPPTARKVTDENMSVADVSFESHPSPPIPPTVVQKPIIPPPPPGLRPPTAKPAFTVPLPNGPLPPPPMEPRPPNAKKLEEVAVVNQQSPQVEKKRRSRFDQPPADPLTIPLPPAGLLASTSIPLPMKVADAPIQTLPPPKLLPHFPRTANTEQSLQPMMNMIPQSAMAYYPPPYFIPLFDPRVPPPFAVHPTFIPPPPPERSRVKNVEISVAEEVPSKKQKLVDKLEQVEQNNLGPMPMDIDDDNEEIVENEATDYLESQLKDVNETEEYDPEAASEEMLNRNMQLEKESEEENSKAVEETWQVGGNDEMVHEILNDDEHVKEKSVQDETFIIKDEINDPSLPSVNSSDDSDSDNSSIDDDADVQEKNETIQVLNKTHLLKEATSVFHNIRGIRPLILQEELDGNYVLVEEERPPPDFYGEPVPNEEDDDDALFEMAAGLPRKKKDMPVVKDEPLANDDQFELDFYNADFNMKASADNKWLIDPDNSEGFALMWSGVRSNYGIVYGKSFVPRVAFQVSIKEFLSTKHLPFDEIDPHDIRVGWSCSTASNILGESSKSYAFCSTGRKCGEGDFKYFGEPFHLKDVITTVLDLKKEEIIYYKNKKLVGKAFSGNLFQPGNIVFPHIATKNCTIYVNFGVECPEKDADSIWSLPDDEKELGTIFVGRLDIASFCAQSRRPPEKKSDCTVLLMIGLPGVGKTTWVENYLKANAHEHWIHFNAEKLIDTMKINGLPRKRCPGCRVDMVLGLASKALTKCIQVACRRRQNYIIDQTNCCRDVRKRRLAMFEGFTRRCIIIMPNELETEARQAKRSKVDYGGEMPIDAMLMFKAVISLPTLEEEPLEDIQFIEPPIDRLSEAVEQVQRYNQEGQPWLRKTFRTRSQPFVSDHRMISESNTENRRASQANNQRQPERINAENYLQVSLGTVNASSQGTRPKEGYAGFGDVPTPLQLSLPIPDFDPSVPPPNIFSPMLGSTPNTPNFAFPNQNSQTVETQSARNE